jgi:hypothetical protein
MISFLWKLTRAVVFAVVVTLTALLLDINASSWHWGVLVFVILITSDAVKTIRPRPKRKEKLL